MSPRVPAVVAVLLFAAAPAFAQDWYEPNPSLARLSADDAYARESARSLRTAGIGAGAIRLDDAGRVLVAGATWYAPRVVRLDADGRLDPTFGDAGVASIPVSGDLRGLEVDAAGRIVVTGFFYEAGAQGPPGYDGPLYGAARLLADGSLDPAFSGDGLLDLDPASGVGGFGAVRTAGGDGAMLAVAEKLGPGYDSAVGLVHDTLVGLVRITADGTIDATYGGSGFAQISRVPYWRDVVDPVADFAVDSAGRAVVAGFAFPGSGDSGPSDGVLRFDATGAVDKSFFADWYFLTVPTPWPAFGASHVALDGAGRIVGLTGAGLLRRLPDGARDPAFAGDGSAWHVATGFPGRAGVYGLTGAARNGLELAAELAQLCAAESADPNFQGDPLCGGGEFLAVATRADRWALAKLVSYPDAKGRPVRGIGVQTIDPANPGAIVSTTYAFSDRRSGGLAGLVITPDGTAAYALGGTFVLRVDLANPKAEALPDLRVRWLGIPRAVDLGGGRYRLTANVRITNASRREVAAAYGFVGFAPGSYDMALVPIPGTTIGQSRLFRLRGRSSVVKRFTWEGGDTLTDLAGARLSIEVACELPDANFADNVATSAPMTPVYAPR